MIVLRYLLESFQKLLKVIFCKTTISKKASDEMVDDLRLGKPCKVVNVFLPFLCWIRIWM